MGDRNSRTSRTSGRCGCARKRSKQAAKYILPAQRGMRPRRVRVHLPGRKMLQLRMQARQGRDRGWPRAVLRLLLYRSGLRSPETRVFPRLAGDHHVNMHEGRGGVLLMWTFIVAIIVFGLTRVISILVLFRYGMSDNQTLPPSTAAETTSTVGTLIAFAIAASHWLPQLGW